MAVITPETIYARERRWKKILLTLAVLGAAALAWEMLPLR
jgi:hypothetical protein